MTKHPGVVPSLSSQSSPMTLDEFAALCLDTVLARILHDDQRRANGKISRARQGTKEKLRTPIKGPRRY